MANIAILINSKDYPYHTPICNMMHSILSSDNHVISILEISSYEYEHQCFAQLKQMSLDILVTLDLAGFCFRTQSGENALNMLYTKNLNLIWGNKPEYTPFLSKKISLSMLFYDATGTDYNLMQIYPNLLYYKSLGKIICFPTSESDEATNQENFLQIWSNFTQEVLLSEK